MARSGSPCQSHGGGWFAPPPIHLVTSLPCFGSGLTAVTRNILAVGIDAGLDRAVALKLVLDVLRVGKARVHLGHQILPALGPRAEEMHMQNHPAGRGDRVG
jgi:hypothetical protein